MFANKPCLKPYSKPCLKLKVENNPIRIECLIGSIFNNWIQIQLK